MSLILALTYDLQGDSACSFFLVFVFGFRLLYTCLRSVLNYLFVLLWWLFVLLSFTFRCLGVMSGGCGLCGLGYYRLNAWF